MSDKENPFLPPMDSDLPIVITNQLYEDDDDVIAEAKEKASNAPKKKTYKIKEILTAVLENENMDTLVAVSPFISEYFVKILAKTSLKYLILVINREDLNPEYVVNAVKLLKTAKFDVDVRARPEGSKFVHMKLLVPHMKINRISKSGGKVTPISSLVPVSAIAGSVNFTRNGISVSDEMLVIFRDSYSINACMETYRKLLEGTVLKYSTKGFIETKRQPASKP